MAWVYIFLVLSTKQMELTSTLWAIPMTVTSRFFLFPQGIVKVGAVDADQHNSLGGQYSVKGFPTIKIFGANKNKPDDYQGTSNSLSIKK